MIAGILKRHCHRGRKPRMYFYQERGRLEVDLILDHGGELTAVEIKAGKTPSSGYFSGLAHFAARLDSEKSAPWRLTNRVVVYAGNESQTRSKDRLVAWSDLVNEPWSA